MNPALEPPPDGAVRGGAALGASRAGRQLLRLGVMILLARLLGPDEFGVVAILAAIFAVGAVFQDFGLSSAIVQRDTVAARTLHTLFWINAGSGALLALLFFVLAEWIAALFGRPELIALCRVAALSFLLNGLALQSRALLQRRMQFATQARADLAASLLSGLAAILLALGGAGWWALIGQMLIFDLLALVLLWRAAPPDIGAPAWSAELAAMLRFGGSLFGFNLLLAVAQNLGTALLGAQVNAAASGLYKRAFALASVPQALAFGVAAHVALPRLSRARHSNTEFARFYVQSAQLTALMTVPIAAAFASLGEPVARFVYGAGWSQAGPLLAAFAPGLAVAPLLHGTGTVMLARGDSGRVLRWGVFGSAVIVACTVLGLRWGALGVALGWSLSQLLLLIPGLRYAFVGTGLSVRTLLRPVAGIYVAGAAMALIAWGARELGSAWAVWWQVPFCLAVSGVVYLVLAYAVFGQRELIDLVVQRLRRRPPAPTP